MAAERKGKEGRKAAPRAFIHPDLPADPTLPLALGFEPLAQTLKQLAVNAENRTPFTVVVKGDWGRGKTTLLKRARHLVDEACLERTPPPGCRRVETLWLNAWKYPSEDSVLAGLLGCLLDRMRQGNAWEQLKWLFSAHAGRVTGQVLSHAASALVKVGLMNHLDATEEGASGLLKSVLEPQSGGRYGAALEKRAYHDTFRPLFAQASHVLLNGVPRDRAHVPEEKLWTVEEQREHAVAVFLDDLDRCHHDRVTDVLEAINLFLDLPGTCFFLGVSWDRLKEALPEHLRPQGDQYLEKVIQVAFELPDVEEGAAREYVRGLAESGQLTAALNAAGDESSGGDVNAVARTLETRHPRHAKRFLNDLSILLSVLREKELLGEGDARRVGPRQVLAWQLLREGVEEKAWKGLTAAFGTLSGELVKWRTHRQVTTELEEDQVDLGPALAQARAHAVLPEYVDLIAELDRRQLTLLLHHELPEEAETLADEAAALGSRAEKSVGAAVEGPTARPRRTQGAVDAASGRIELPGDGPLEWVELPAGAFDMGAEDIADDEKPVHRVELTQPYRMGLTPVTNTQYGAYVAATKARAPRHWKAGAPPAGLEDHPVVHVSWSDATAFCGWLNEACPVEDWEAGLPTEAQWEHAARGPSGRAHPWGGAEPDRDRANYGMEVGTTTPVGSYRKGATPEGLLDMAGNVWEWCADWMGPYRNEPQVDPTGPERGSARVVRGGAFGGHPDRLRSAGRVARDPHGERDDIGFRVSWRRSAGRI